MQIETAQLYDDRRVAISRLLVKKRAPASLFGNWTILLAFLFWTILLRWPACQAAEVVLIQGKQRHGYEEDGIRRISEFYGLELRVVGSDSLEEGAKALTEIKKSYTVAVVGSPESISGIDRTKLRRALARGERNSIPLLMIGLQPGGDRDQLHFWSGGTLQGCTPISPESRFSAMVVGSAGALVGALAASRLPSVTTPGCGLDVRAPTMVEPVLSFIGDSVASVPFFVRRRTGNQDVFFLSEIVAFDESWIGKHDSLPQAFSALAPFIFFLSSAAGEYAWHPDARYANLTIDDAWLTQPFGRLDYHAVLKEMQTHKFHTTVAFVPWNFDRSEPDVAGLFLKHPEYFSVCVHGNDHAHREFGDYSRNPLDRQLISIRQGIARMERFQALTGIPYDRIMVFPHAVAPQPTFSALKMYGFLGTANASNVPSGAEFPTDPTFLLRSYTTSYSGLLSLSRIPASGNLPKLEIAIQTFLGNPVLFYGHESLFSTGTGAFDQFADMVNQLDPHTQWASLGEIARHTHLMRRRDNGDFDVLMSSPEMDLHNPRESSMKFFVDRIRYDMHEIDQVLVDGLKAQFEAAESTPFLLLSVPAHATVKVRIKYKNDLTLEKESVSKHSLYVFVLRRLSDFRDLELSRTLWGDKLVRLYYQRNLDAMEIYLEERWWFGAILPIGLLWMYWHRRWKRKSAWRFQNGPDTQKSIEPSAFKVGSSPTDFS